MSETTTNTSGACELVLDYVYGELDEARKRTFEEHLPTCARCQQEVASFGRVRSAVKQVMPAVEPTAPLATGALHAQLMHAAAQRKPRRGILLAFPRKIVEHPALSAAAMFVLVGGAIAINWSRGKLAMPAAEQTTTVSDTKQAQLDQPKPTEGAAAPVLAEPMPAEKAKEAELGTITKGGADKQAAAGDTTRIALETPSGMLTVQRPAAHRAVATAAPKKLAPPRMKNIATDGKMAKYDNAFADDLAKSKDEAAGENGLGSVGGGVAGGTGRGELAEGAKSSAPAREHEKAAHGYAAGAPAPSPQAPATMPQAAAPPPPASVTTSPSSTNERDYYRAPSQKSSLQQSSQSQSQNQAVAKPAANARNFDVARKQADEWAKSGRCEEAIKMYQELEKSSQYISPTERVNWVRCLTQSGRQEEALKRLDELKAEKRVTNAQIQDAEKELNDSRARRVDNKKAKKAPAPADRAPAATVQEQQQQRQAEPTQAAPPDSTNTKVKSKSSY